ncbi:hypothetical protein F544_13320 [Bibersteinia trehalosi USDA-ARS-USMARC-190]|uniref:Putative gluconeogenesis factor n=1 Tax=Bibersteinia trehalosi USDA-ARS-USMARC-190 TaxID=1263832 RepID=W0R8C2_BIBTR|nr:uridine diphosphate-N-acetylglucosamine-binding protein YvcK [Bibersteinia trehalosi]AHG86560.1 hypothetical protein F544_13320 [Bibersteinia trehalosi USDA-ARS-USMARC-190]
MNYPQLNRLNSVVAIGGGHGLGRVLSSLSFLKERLTGIVATSDNGGSTGRIRSQHGGIAWGDLRNCLTQITIKPTVASALFEYRFSGNGELAGHNLGNLILKALEDMQIRPTQAIELVRNLLYVRVGLLPMSEEPVDLLAILANGKQILGEVEIDQLKQLPQQLRLSPNVPATPEALNTLKNAELVLLGPGSFLTSVMPSLLIKELAEILSASNAKIIFIDNIGREHGIAGQLSLNDRIKWLERCIGQGRLNAVITTLEEQSSLPDTIQVLRQLLSSDDVYYRHDRHKLTQAIEQLLGAADNSN